MIETEAECQAAAQQMSLPWNGAAGTEWASGCLFHGGGVYYSPHGDGTTQSKFTYDAHHKCLLL